jgi:dTDP-4-amino-4,6-dideoxygalactose transaminase
VIESHVPTEHKIGKEELLELVDLWRFDEPSRRRIAGAIAEGVMVAEPYLGRYGSELAKVDQLENLARRLLGVRHAVALHSGTSALETALVAGGIGPGDEVIVPGYTFLATPTAVVEVGAVPVIAEIDESLTLDPADVERRITPRTKAVVPVHMIGSSADLTRIVEVARRHDLLVIEDACQATGVTYHGRRVGTIGDLGCFSISTYKPIGAGEAGLCVTDDDGLYYRAVNYHDTAATWRTTRFGDRSAAGELFSGTNLRLSELEGAVNLVQMRKMDTRLERQRAAAAAVRRALASTWSERERPLHDLAGDAGYHLVFLATTADDALQAIRGLLARSIGAWRYGLVGNGRDWHVFTSWDHILGRRPRTSRGCSWACPRAAAVSYSAAMCPRTLDLLDRAVIVNVDDGWSSDEAERTADEINQVALR